MIPNDPRPIREDAIHRAIWEMLCLKRIDRLIAWHTPNGLPAKPSTIERFKRLGFYAGMSDLTLVQPDTARAHFLEIKTPDGRLSTNQRGFQFHAEAAHAPYEIARSVTDAEEIMRSWGLLREARAETRRAA